MGRNTASMGSLGFALIAFAIFSGFRLVTGEEADIKEKVDRIGYYGGEEDTTRPVYWPRRIKNWRLIFPQNNRGYYDGTDDSEKRWREQEFQNKRSELFKEDGGDPWESAYSKRSPNCMSKCVNQGQIHPIMCHSLC